MAQRYANKVVLVTAGASGIGAAAVEAFAREGARLMVSDIDTAGGEAVVERLRGQGCEAHFLRADATAEEDVERLIGTTIEIFGALHVAANVVGDVHSEAAGPEFHQQSLLGWEATLAVSLQHVPVDEA
jgi:NAD(P)-dependent dehydrogenase (short-subunit alcohol dehydrogenase family)